MIEFRNVALKFNDRILFEDFNLMICDKDKIIFNSPSGMGKSSLAKLILGLVKAYKGQVYFDAEEISGKNIAKVRSQISYVSQDVDIPNMKIRDFIQEVYSYKVNAHLLYNEEEIHGYFLRFALDPEIMEKSATEISGGERQRLGVIIAALMERPVWILDEVTSGLDKELKDRIVDFVKACDKTVLVISHDEVWEQAGMKEVKWG